MTDTYTGIDTFSIENIPVYADAAKNGCVVACDTETTGLHNHDDIVELAWVVMQKGEVTQADFTYVQNLSVKLDGPEAQQVNGLSDAYLAVNGRHPKEAFQKFVFRLWELIDRYGYIVLAAHNLPFDLRMLQSNMARYSAKGFQMIPDYTRRIVGCDTKKFVKSLNLPKSILPDNHLRNCIAAFALDAKNSHEAMDDTKACMELFKFLTAEG